MSNAKDIDELRCFSAHKNKENMDYNKSRSHNLSVYSQKMKKNKRTGGYNLRKSLAWDKAFSTEEGVLNSLELSTIVCGSSSKPGDGEGLSHMCDKGADLWSFGSLGCSVEVQKLVENLFTRTCAYNDDNSRTISQDPEKTVPQGDAKKIVPKGGQLDISALASHKRLLNASPVKLAAANSEIHKMPAKRVPSLLSRSEMNLAPAAGQTKLNKRNTLPARLLKSTSLKEASKPKSGYAKNSGSSTKSRSSTSQNAKDSICKTCSEIPFSINQQAALVHKSDASTITSNEVLPTNRTGVVKSVNARVGRSLGSFGHARDIGQSMQGRAVKPSGLPMPSPSLSFFSETALVSGSLPQKNSQPSNIMKSGIPRNFRAADKALESKPQLEKLTQKAKQHAVGAKAYHGTPMNSSSRDPSSSNYSKFQEDGMRYENKEKGREPPVDETPNQVSIQKKLQNVVDVNALIPCNDNEVSRESIEILDQLKGNEKQCNPSNSLSKRKYGNVGHKNHEVENIDIGTVDCNSEMKTSDEEDKTEMLQKLSKDYKKGGTHVLQPPRETVPFSEEWLAAIEAAGEEILTLKSGPVQHSPPDKLSVEPSPWSPVKNKSTRVIGPFDCTKFANPQQQKI